jgi:hypothetical protein
MRRGGGVAFDEGLALECERTNPTSSLTWLLRSGVGWNDRDAAVTDLDGYLLADAEASFIEPVASEADERDGWRQRPVAHVDIVAAGADFKLA